MSKSRYDMIIVGGGPIGLATAYEAAKKGNQILLVEKRNEEESILRPQVVVLQPDRKRQLFGMVGEYERLDLDDLKFLDTLASSAEVQIRPLQKFILKRIRNFNTTWNNESIKLSYETQLSSVNLHGGSLEIIENNETKPVSFKRLIGADGANSQTLDLVNQNLPEEEKIQRTTPKSMKHLENSFHLGTYVKLSRKDQKDLNIPEREFVSAFMSNKNPGKLFKSNELYFLRFDKKSHLKNNKKSVKMGFVGELPKHIYKEAQQYQKKINAKSGEITKLERNANHSGQQETLMLQQALLEKANLVDQRNQLLLNYAKRAAAGSLKIDEDALQIEVVGSKKTPAKDKLKILTFQGGSLQAEKAAIELNGHGFYLAGDAYFTPNYPVGHGMNDGLEASAKLGKIPPNAESMPEHIFAYNKLTSYNASFAMRMMQCIHWFRKLGFSRTKVAKLLEQRVEEDDLEDQIDLRSSLAKSVPGSNSMDQFQKYIWSETDRLIMAADKSAPEFKKCLNEWKEFLKKCPRIAAEYQHEIYKSLKKINNHIHGKPELNRIYDNFYLSYEMDYRSFNSELIKKASKNPNQFDQAGRTPLTYAIQNSGDFSTIKRILELGADPNKAFRRGNIFTHQAINDADITNLLFEKGANPFKPILTDYDSPFFLSLWKQSSFYNPIFSCECLMAAQDKASPLYKFARNLPNEVITDTVNSLKSLGRNEICNFVLSCDDQSILKKLAYKLNDHIKKLVASENSPQLTVKSPEEIANLSERNLYDYIANAILGVSMHSLQQIQNDKKKKNFLVTSAMSFFNRDVKPANDPKIKYEAKPNQESEQKQPQRTKKM